MTHADRQVVAGVDTHKDFHVAAVLDTAGRLLGVATFPANDAGYEALHCWVEEHGELFGVGVEGCGSYGAGLARDLRGRGVKVVEVCRPNRQLRRRRGKSDAVDAEAAARAVLGGVDLVTPKTADGPVEVLRALRLARRSAIKARDQAANQLHLWSQRRSTSGSASLVRRSPNSSRLCAPRPCPHRRHRRATARPW